MTQPPTNFKQKNKSLKMFFRRKWRCDVCTAAFVLIDAFRVTIGPFASTVKSYGRN
jgi:hypothetical protein